MLFAEYRPAANENRMSHVGDVVSARNRYYNQPLNNLKFLMEQRLGWMNAYIKPEDTIVEIGCGTGVTRDIVTNGHLTLTDFAEHPWIDKKADAMNMPYPDASFNVVISNNMIHHVASPIKLFKEMHRILKPGGYLLIQEINASFMMRLVLRLMRHEGYSMKPNVFDENVICTDPEDLWSANCAIPNLLFDHPQQFAQAIPFFKIKHQSFSEFFVMLGSGGVIAKTFTIPLPFWALKVVRQLDRILIALFPKFFPLQRQIVLQKV